MIHSLNQCYFSLVQAYNIMKCQMLENELLLLIFFVCIFEILGNLVNIWPQYIAIYKNTSVVYLWVADKSIVPSLYSPLSIFLKRFAFICPIWPVEVFYKQTHLFCPLIVGHKPNNLLLIACAFPQA